MTTFDDRERGFEAKFAFDQEVDFKIKGRRDRLLGEWAGLMLGKTGADLEAYVHDVVHAGVETSGDEDVFRKITGDLAGHVSEADVRLRMDALLGDARAQVEAGR